jgi:adenosyl cobinamide kinase/adenosyl cobinamide phosphate guanylyltransferase
LITLVLGGARSGKSEVAERLAGQLPAPVLYVATAAVDGDTDLADRVEGHRARRPSSWTTIEPGADLSGALRSSPEGTVLVDALGPWVAAHEDFAVDAAGLVDALTSRTGDAVVVSEEVGLGVHPSTDVGRRFRDALGELNRAIADAADEVLFVIAGRVLPI